MIRPRAGITKVGEPVIGADQFLDLGACVGLDQAHGDFANDLVAFIAPRPSVGAHRVGR